MAGSRCTSAREYFDRLGSVIGAIDCGAIDALAGLLFDAWREGHSVFVFGNGGSAYTANHIALDLMKTARVDGKPALRAVGLPENSGMTTAIGNDIDFDQSFSYPLEVHARAGDLAIAVSCSGNSANVLRACQWASEHGLKVVTLSGFTGGRMCQQAHLHINVPSDNYGVIEDLHLSIGHIAAQSLHEWIAADRTAR